MILQSSPGQRGPSTGPTLLPVVRLTGERSNNRITVVVNDWEVALTCNALTTLVRLLIARATSATGMVPAEAISVHRLRKALRTVPGGAALIETGCKTEYRLAMRPEEMATHVVVDESFFELEPLGIVCPQQMAQLRALCAVGTQGVIGATLGSASRDYPPRSAAKVANAAPKWCNRKVIGK